MIRISTTSKLDGIRSWSLQALDTCPGSVSSPGVLVDACKGCYATTGNYRYPNVKAPRLENREDWQRIEWCDDMVKALDKDRFFRWFGFPAILCEVNTLRACMVLSLSLMPKLCPMASHSVGLILVRANAVDVAHAGTKTWQ